MTNNAQAFVERAEKVRDLRTEIGNLLAADDEQEVIIYEWSPGRTSVSIWSMETGEEITLPRYMAVDALQLVGPLGYRFTAQQSLAPRPRVNTVKCFLHKDAPERPFLVESGIIGEHEIGCQSEHLANEASKWTHARNRHVTRYGQYLEERDRRETAMDRARQQQTTDAMLALANRGGEAQSAEPPSQSEEPAEPRRGPGRPRKEDGEQWR